jgi:2-polyprenyl-3-methyl-5-hydroxy-6-metoxy-1,4-benzoquinol methylase
MNSCPLCEQTSCDFYYQDKKRSYLRCSHCQLIHVPKAQHLNSTEEKAIYDLHTNDPNDLGYRKFLQRFIDPLTKQLPSGACGLDFGSGPGPTLSLMLNELGYSCQDYDLYYANDKELLLPSHYDFVTSTEVVEHLAQPNIEFPRLFSLLKPHGCLAIMTKRSINLEKFKTWHYIQDPTHICFYNEASLQWVAKTNNASVSFPASDVALFKKLN